MEPSLEYIAGLFDGEGSVAIYPAYNGTRSVHFRGHMVQNDNEFSAPLWEYMRERWGGSVSRQTTGSGRTKLNWQIGHENAVKFFKDIRPFVILKADQIDLALEWWEFREPAQRERGAHGYLVKKSDEYWERTLDVASRLKAMKRKEVPTSDKPSSA